MTLHDFIALDINAQQKAICKAGDHVAWRDEGNYRLFLYQIDSFYVEVFFDREHSVIRQYRPFSSVGELQPYLDELDIDGILIWNYYIHITAYKGRCIGLGFLVT